MMALIVDTFELTCNNFGDATLLPRLIMFVYMFANKISTFITQPPFHMKIQSKPKPNGNF